MRNRFALAATVLAFVAAGAGGCASSGTTGSAASGASAGPTFPITVVIDNDLPGLAGVSTFIIAGANGRKSLGPVDSGRKKTFTYNGVATNYTFTYRTTGAAGAEVVSQAIQIAGPETVTWHLNSNQLVEDK